MEAASQILESRGAEAFNTTEVAERAGVSIGTLYQYFPDKHAILLAIARREVDDDAPHRPGLQRALIKTLLEIVESLGRLGGGAAMQLVKVQASPARPPKPRRARGSAGWESRGADMVLRRALNLVAPAEPALITLRNRSR